MKHYALALALLIGLSAPIASAQSTDFQTVKVGGRTYQVDPFYLFVCFPVEGTTRLPLSGTELEHEYTVQCFIRIDGQMTPIEEFPTDDSGIMGEVEVGQAIISEPQTKTETLDGEPQP